VVRREIKFAIIVAVVIAIILLSIWFAFGMSNPFYVVASGSMVPNLNVNDFVIVSHKVPFNSLKIGDIIVFKTYGTDASGNHATIVHRVAEIVIDQNNGQKIIRTKGDANPDSIPGVDYPIFQPLYIGKVVYVIPKLGVITNVFRPPANYILIGAILILLVYYLRKTRPTPASDKK
jgi:signal peptidase I